MNKTYTTVHGDMWDSIAYKTMGDCSYTAALMRLNAKHTDVYIFEAGVRLTLPEAKPEDAVPTLPWKRKAAT